MMLLSIVIPSCRQPPAQKKENGKWALIAAPALRRSGGERGRTSGGVPMDALDDAMAAFDVSDSEDEDEALSSLRQLEVAVLATDAAAVAAVRQAWQQDGRGAPDDATAALTLAEFAASGNYRSILDGAAARELFRGLDDLTDVVGTLQERVFSFVEGVADDASQQFRAFQCLVVGIACLNVFLQCNYTGPLLENEELDAFCLLPAFDAIAAPAREAERAEREALAAREETEEEMRTARGLNIASENAFSKPQEAVSRLCARALAVDGQDPYAFSKVPQMLLAARAVLTAVGIPHVTPFTEPVVPEGAKDAADVDKAPRLITPEVAKRLRGIRERCEFDKPHRAPMPACRSSALDPLCTAGLWAARSAIAHARLLFVMAVDEVPTLWYEVRCGFKRAAKGLRFKLPAIPSVGDDVDLAALRDGARASTVSSARAAGGPDRMSAELVLEYGMAQSHLRVGKRGKEAFHVAQGLLHLDLRVTGSMAWRMKNQLRAVAVLRLAAKSAFATGEDAVRAQAAGGAPSSAEATDGEGATSGKVMEEGEDSAAFFGRTGAAVREVKLDDMVDNTLLEAPRFEGEAEEQAEAGGETGLTLALEQAVVLALCLDVANSNPAHGLTSDEMMPYVDAVVEAPLNWMVHSSALLERSWLECESLKRRERGIFQIQALADQHTTRLTLTQSSSREIEEAAPAEERLRLIHALTYPPRWELRRDLAMRYASFGAFMAAAEIFDELGLWDDVVDCYKELGHYARAERLIRKRMEESGGEEAATPRMLVALGDVTQNPSYYEKAWAASGQRHARAMVQLGLYRLQEGQLAEGKDALLLAVGVKPLQPAVWFKLGATCMRLKEWKLGLKAFGQAALQVPDAAEAWGNIGAIHMRSGDYEAAYPALQEGLKHMRRNWRIWENFFFTCVSLGKFGEAIYVCEQLLDLRDARSAEGRQRAGVHRERTNVTEFDPRYLGILAKKILLEGESGLEVSYDRLVERLGKMFERAANTLANDAMVWEVMAVYHTKLDDMSAVMEDRMKQCRCLQSRPGWERDGIQTDDMVKALAVLADCYLRHAGEHRKFYELKMYLRSLMRKVDAEKADAALLGELNEAAARVEERFREGDRDAGREAAKATTTDL